MSQFRTSRTFDALFLIVLGAFLWWAGVHRANLGDWVFFLRYSPTAETAQVATDAGLSDAGRHLFYRTDPQFVSKAAIVAECDIERLGCITARGQVFILDAADQHDQTVVTAAHEMLHLAYRRLPQAKKDELAPLLDRAIDENLQNGLTDELKDETSPEDRRDEAHSLLGTEYEDLPTELEQYYSQYFSDRSKVVAAEAASIR
jgi:hypothetical protein